MSSLSITPTPYPFQWMAPAIATFVIVTILFYTDEGYNNFNWVSSPGHWIVFLIYAGLIFPFQYGLGYLFLRKENSWKRVLLFLLCSIPVSVLGMWMIFSE